MSGIHVLILLMSVIVLTNAYELSRFMRKCVTPVRIGLMAFYVVLLSWAVIAVLS